MANSTFVPLSKLFLRLSVCGERLCLNTMSLSFSRVPNVTCTCTHLELPTAHSLVKERDTATEVRGRAELHLFSALSQDPPPNYLTMQPDALCGLWYERIYTHWMIFQGFFSIPFHSRCYTYRKDLPSDKDNDEDTNSDGRCGGMAIQALGWEALGGATVRNTNSDYRQSESWFRGII